MSRLRPLRETEAQWQYLRRARRKAHAIRKGWRMFDGVTQRDALAIEASAWDAMMRHGHSLAADAEARRDDCLRRLTELEQQGGEP